MDQKFNHKYMLAGAGVLALVVVIGLNFFSSSSLPSTKLPMLGIVGEKGYAPGVGGSTMGRDSFNSPTAPSQVEKSASQSSSGSTVLTDRKIVKNGNLALLVDTVEDAASAMQSLAGRLGGFTSDSRVWEQTVGMKSGSVTIRVPAARFDEAMSEIKKLAVKVETEAQTTDDVTEASADLDVRVVNLRAQEAEYLKILKQAQDVQDILSVTQYLTSVRTQIEQTEGQIRYLSSQVEMSTITATFRAEADVEVFGLRWRPLVVAKQAFHDALSSLTGYIDTMVRIILYLPVLALWLGTIALVVYVARRIIRRFYARTPLS